MKPHGPIPPGFRADPDDMLLIGGDRAEALADMAGDTPLFVYDSAMLTARVAEWRAAMPAEVQLHYAMKANPYAPLLAWMARLVDGFDVASGGELKAALASGMSAADISFAGPGKRDRELEAAIAAGATLNLESAGEAERALSIADHLGVVPRLAVRVNPDFDLKGSGMKMGGGAKPFGVDAADVPSLVRRLIDAGADWQGFHIFAGSQALDAAAIAETQAQTVALAGRLANDIGHSPALVNLGGGMGVPYFPGDKAVDVAAVGDALAATLTARDPVLAGSRFAMELGRWLVAEAGVYLTRIVDRKTSHGETFLVTDGGLHHQLAASGNFGTVIRRNYPIAVAGRFGAAPAETVSVVGCLCTPLDRLGDQVALPGAAVGDLIAIFQAGAYGASASPATFLGQGPAREMLV
ncbi:pyridoxal-dependent decarboxylase, exosortase A system-associated [Sphingopyxis sp. RIFCSPHIGHO2_12_FULL_65_19]|uniref:pyridoxal-dependent decarboxylase, exosortase A system-associated n=1 Tax=Sphingopyxis sp. RIFCSPHIGHO2_12_FULL_65_19 TaxID=1802172 RepID=UPI0008B6FF55|nr:pyridoxal-dependent decarboxylase, exosortase A system-associated [Sphingopyxis sp. RIFCSPHIGHO2_12_FULL_65_19]OHD10012.1 MAG: pyridoxal-dependent decarboxylase, exosortase A system-associated [Sphingopyxis sp. RIFCSPHIGHO2_12_FULL_65_19]